MKKEKRAILLILLLAGVAVSFSILWKRMPAGGKNGKRELILYCGAGIRTGAAALIEAFQSGRDVRIIPTYEGSGQSLGKIAAGARGDLFMPGSEFYVDKAIEKGLVDKATKKIVAYFVPVLLVRKDNPKAIRSLADLKKTGVRVGIGDERSAAIGQVTLDLFRKNHIDFADISPNIVYRSGTVDELGVAIQVGTVDAVITWDVSARNFLASGLIIPLPAEKNVFSAIPVTILKSAKYQEAAREFIDFVTSPEGKRIIAEKGFTVACPGQ